MTRAGNMIWIDGSLYRSAVFDAIDKPRTGKAILEICKESCPKMSYQDVRHTLRALEARQIAKCLNPSQQTGRLYVVVDGQGKSAQTVSDRETQLLAKVARAKSKKAILNEVGLEGIGDGRPKTAELIRRNLLNQYPMNLSWVIASLRSLVEMDLVECLDRTSKRGLKIYSITSTGRGIIGRMVDGL